MKGSAHKMKTVYKYIAIGTVSLILGTGIGYTYSENRKQDVSEIPNNQTISSISDSVNTLNNTSSNYDSKSIVPFSSDIVIYNSHADENYASGMNVTDVGSQINDKLVKEGLKSSFIKFAPPTEYKKAYQSTRDVITKNVKDCNNTVLLDIHRDLADKNNLNTKRIIIELTKESPNYESNRKFASLLVKEIIKASSNEIAPIISSEYKKGTLYFNQDLSKHSLLIEIGNDKSSDSDIEKCTNALVSALKNIQKDLTK